MIGSGSFIICLILSLRWRLADCRCHTHQNIKEDKRTPNISIWLSFILVYSVLTRRRDIFSVVVGEAEDLRDDEAVLVLHARRVLFQRGRLGPRGLQEQPAGKGNGFKGTFHICFWWTKRTDGVDESEWERERVRGVYGTAHPLMA